MRRYRGHPPRAIHIREIVTEAIIHVARDPKSDNWPCRAQILQAQRYPISITPSNFTIDEDGLVFIGEACWIPFNAEELQLNLLAIVHAGYTGHRGT